MLRVSSYRSLALAAVLALGALAVLPGCEADGKKNQTIKAEMHEKWDRARLGVMYQLAKQQYEVGDYDKCRQTLAQATAVNAPYAPIHVLAAKLEIEKGNLEVAAAQLKLAQQIDPASSDGYYFLGVVFQRWQNATAAAENYRLAWERKPGEVNYLLAYVEMLITMNQVDQAQQLLEEKLTYFEQTAAIRVALGKIYMLQGDREKACRHFRDAVILSPDDLQLRQTYAEALYASGKYADALPVLEDLRKNPNTPDIGSVTMILGRTYVGLNRTREARNCFQELTQQNSANVAAWLGLGRVYLQDNDPTQAIQTARRVLKLQPDNVQAMILQALAEQKQHRWADARTTLVEAQKLAPKDSTILCMLGVASQGLGETVQAAGFYQQALDANPHDTWAVELLASVKPTSGQD